MNPIDWLILLLPSLAVVYIAWRTQQYNKGVAGFLSGGRVARRYVVAVASGEAGFGQISAVAILKTLQINTNDDGRVIGHMNADDYAAAQAVRAKTGSENEKQP